MMGQWHIHSALPPTQDVNTHQARTKGRPIRTNVPSCSAQYAHLLVFCMRKAQFTATELYAKSSDMNKLRRHVWGCMELLCLCNACDVHAALVVNG